MRNIAFSGKMCSGKTTLASYLVGKYGYKKVSFAEGVYKVAREVFGMKEKDRELLQKVGMQMREIQSNVWVHMLKKKILEIEMADFGSGVYTADSREPVDWIPFKSINFTCDDCRFTNEALALQNWGWLVIRLDCPEQQRMDRVQKLYPDTPLEALQHISETELDTYEHFDYELNAGKPLNEVISDLDVIVGGERNEEMYNLPGKESN